MQPSVQNHIDQPRNPNYEKDIIYVTKFLKLILNFIGIWPAMLKGIGRFLPEVTIVLSNFVLVFFEVQCVLHVTLEQKDPMLRMRIIGLAYYSFICLLKYWALTARKSRIKCCIEEVNTDWKQVELERDRTCMLKYGKIGRDLTVFCAVFLYCGNIFYVTILQYAIGSQIDDNNRTIRILLYPMYSGHIDAQQSPVYEITYTLQCLCSIMMNAVICGCCGLAAFFATHTCGQIDVIMSQLDDLVDGKFSKKNQNSNTRLMEIVQRHTKLLKFSAMFETILQEVCLFEFVGTTFLICLLEYYCITDWQHDNKLGVLTYSAVLTSMTFNISMWCYIGDLLIEKSTSIGISCCMIDWYRLPSKTTRGLVLIIAMSSTPMKISAGRIVYISLPTFGNVLKSSFAYFNFIRNTLME